MVYYSHSIIRQIKAATDDAALAEIISKSVRELPSKRGNGTDARRRGFMLNMIMALRYLKAEGLSAAEAENIGKAIQMLEKVRSGERENLF